MTETKYYTWRHYQCSYDLQNAHQPGHEKIPALLLIHPIGVGLSRTFWQRFYTTWSQQNYPNIIYNPDLLGCGSSAMPRLAYYPEDWADQLQYFVETVIKKPVILIIQGALFPVGIYCVQKFPHLIQGLVLSGPPAWGLMTTPTSPQGQKIAWNLFDSPLGKAFYRYARRQQFLKSFSIRQLFDQPEDVDTEWLKTLEKGSRNLDSRHAVFAFLAGFWRENYEPLITAISQPTLVIFGETASSITKNIAQESPEERLAQYLKYLPNGKGCKIAGRNVLPYESTEEFVRVTGEFVKPFN